MSDVMGRWVVSWSTSYDDVADAHEAVRVALGDLEHVIKHSGEGADVFIVEDTKTGTVSVITAETALTTRISNTIINIDQSINYSPSITINAGGDTKHGKKGKKGIGK